MTTKRQRLSILMLGEALERPGGVVAVERATLESAPERLAFRHIATLPGDGSFGQLRKLITLTRAIITLVFSLSTQNVDIVHIHVSMGASIPRKCLLARLALLFKKPVVMHTHGGAFAEQYPTMPGILQRFIAATFERCDAVITLAETWRRFYIDALGIDAARALILRNPVNLPASLPSRPAGPPVRFLYLGMISEPKGAFDLIEAMALLSDEERRGLRLVIAGHGQVEKASATVRKRGLAEVITVRGWLNAKERDALLEEIHVFVLPSHFEGLPMALLEAMSFGLAPIATAVGGIPDILDDGVNGLLVAPGDHAALVRSIRRLAQDEDLRMRLAKAARRSVEPYSAEGYAEALVQIYQRILADGTAQDPERERAA